VLSRLHGQPLRDGEEVVQLLEGVPRDISHMGPLVRWGVLQSCGGRGEWKETGNLEKKPANSTGLHL
jgi:hypothetical protein